MSPVRAVAVLASSLLCGLAMHPCHAQATPASAPDEAWQTVRRYSAAISAYDCQALTPLTSPAMTEDLVRGGQDPQRWLCDLTDLLRDSAAREVLGDVVTSLSEGQYRLVIVRLYRFAHNGDLDRDAVVLAHYAVHSNDGGVSWHVLENGCTRYDWLQRIYPPGTAGLALRPARMILLGE